MKKLIKEYSNLRHEIFEYTNVYFDAMSYDIDGYCEEKDADINDLKNQVSAFKILLKALKKINYVYS